METFHLELTTVGAGCAVLRVGGEIDLYTAPELREQVIKAVGEGVRYMVADLREVDFLDSTGLGVLVGTLRRLRERDGSLTLVTGSDRIRTILRITGLDRVFTLCSSVSDAIAGDGHWQAAMAHGAAALLDRL